MSIHSTATLHEERLWTPTVSWGAVFAGLVLSLIVYLVLSVLGTAIGASAIDPLGDRNPFSGFGMGAGIWAGATTLLAIAVGGFVAGYLARRSGALHGLLAWGLTTLVTVYLLVSATGSALNVAGGAAKTGLATVGAVAGAGVSAAAPAVGNAVQRQLDQAGISLDANSLQSELEKLLRQTGKPELQPENLKNEAQAAASQGQASAESAATAPQNADADAKGWLAGVLQRGERVLNAADKEALVNIIMARTGKSRAEAEQIANNYEQTYNQARAKLEEAKQQAEQKAREAGAEAAKNVARGSWGTLVVLLIGAAVAAGCGMLGFRRQRPAGVIVAA
ncbi:hypothetical protein M4R22_04135 [Acidovorax sp. GBBC 3334]|uniref:hypothetical protein n=1 Tax=Acidovorax sp. GBBC 3334 TaxID=2940496 RepID=UPI0023036133|nr:hypothetical protein [Acidovorax sp. GBBC 3334]MDA8453945.1 hypothetical protein [Acidovorax sp. GBBC 3334]